MLEPPSRGAHDLLLVVGLAAGMIGLTLVSAGLLQSSAAMRSEPREPAWWSSPKVPLGMLDDVPTGSLRAGVTASRRPIAFTASDVRVVIAKRGRNVPGRGWDLRRELTELARLQRRSQEPIPGHYATPVLAPAVGADRQHATPVSTREIIPLPLDSIAPSRPR